VSWSPERTTTLSKEAQLGSIYHTRTGGRREAATCSYSATHTRPVTAHMIDCILDPCTFIIASYHNNRSVGLRVFRTVALCGCFPKKLDPSLHEPGTPLRVVRNLHLNEAPEGDSCLHYGGILCNVWSFITRHGGDKSPKMTKSIKLQCILYPILLDLRVETSLNWMKAIKKAIKTAGFIVQPRKSYRLALTDRSLHHAV